MQQNLSIGIDGELEMSYYKLRKMKDQEQYGLIVMKCNTKLKTYDDVLVNSMIPTDFIAIIMHEFEKIVTLNLSLIHI